MLEYLLIAFNKVNLEDEKTEHICYVVEMNDKDKEAVTLINRLVFETDICKQL
jgi:hypothetical protein